MATTAVCIKQQLFVSDNSCLYHTTIVCIRQQLFVSDTIYSYQLCCHCPCVSINTGSVSVIQKVLGIPKWGSWFATTVMKHSIIANNDAPRQTALCEAGKYTFLALAKSVPIWYRRLYRLAFGHGVSPA